MRLIISVFSIIFLMPSYTRADCSQYPKSVGIEYVEVVGGFKILSTARASVPLDDSELYLDGIEEATLEAKIAISEFFREEVSQSCNSETSTIKNIKIQGEEKDLDFQKIKTNLCTAIASTQTMLRGVLLLGNCYTPGKFVLVTVGVKPDSTKAAAVSTNNMIDQSSTDENSEASVSVDSRSLSNVKGYSNTQMLEKF
jgi:hypothetical protein